MKKIFILTLFIFSATFSLQADIIYPDGTVPAAEPASIKKISRGITNMLFCYFELPKTFFDATRDEGVLSLQPYSLVLTRGVHKTWQRFRGGVYDIETAFSDNKALLHLEPETLGFNHIIPGLEDQFKWQTIDTHTNPNNLSVFGDK